MVNPNVHDMHRALEDQHIPIDSVHWNREKQTIELAFQRGVREEQKTAAQKLVDEWDQEAVNAAKAASFDTLPSVETIGATKSVKDLQEMALQLRAYIDNARRET